MARDIHSLLSIDLHVSNLVPSSSFYLSLLQSVLVKSVVTLMIEYTFFAVDPLQILVLPFFFPLIENISFPFSVQTLSLILLHGLIVFLLVSFPISPYQTLSSTSRTF